jgi:hypothetical protein
VTAENAPQCRHLVGNGRKKRPCKNKPVDDGDYCRVHVDHPDRRVEAAKVSLHEHVENAIRALGGIVAEPDQRKDADVIKAALGILDRTGHGPSQTFTVQGADERLDDLIRARRRDDE